MLANLELGAERKMLNTIVTVRSESSKAKGIWMASVLLFCRRSVEEDEKSVEQAFV